MEDLIKDSDQPPKEQQTEKELFSASSTIEPRTDKAKLELHDNPLDKFAGCMSFDYYNITFKCQVTRNHLGKFLDFLLNAKWENEWGSIDVEEILKVEKTDAPIRTNLSEES